MRPESTRFGEIPANLSVAFLLLPEFTLSTFSGFVDALRIAADEVDRSRQVHCRWTILGPDRVPVRSSCGVTITPWEALRDPAEYDYIVVVGGLARGLKRIDERILGYLRHVGERGGAVIGLCLGSFALARAGLMQGYRCCVHWGHLNEFKAEFPGHRAESNSVFVVDGKRITCAGGEGAIDLALYIIERHCGRSLARKVASGMLLESAHGARRPQPRPETQWFHDIESDLVQRAVLLMEQQSLGERVVIRDIAARLGVSVKTLGRAFQQAVALSPSAFLRALRVSHGRWDLLNTKKSIGWIASDYGFSDASHFTRVFRECYGSTPAAARAGRGRGSRRRDRRISPARRQPKTALDKMLWGNPRAFATIDWPSELPERPS